MRHESMTDRLLEPVTRLPRLRRAVRFSHLAQFEAHAALFPGGRRKQ